MRLTARGATVTPGFRAERLLRVGFVGCGDHSFRNIYPALRYVEFGGIDATEEHLRIFAAVRQGACGETVDLAGIED